MLAINGYSGFIGSTFIKLLNDQEIEFKVFGRKINNEEFLKDVKTILFLSSPSDSNDFKDVNNMAISMIDNYIYNLNMIYKVNPNIHIIFGSSVAVIQDSLYTNNYALYKYTIEQYIINRFNNYTILRIPRVYGQNRLKGLMRSLREKPIETINDDFIDFIDIKDFILELEEKIFTPQKDKIIYFEKNFKSMTPKEIKEYYEL